MTAYGIDGSAKSVRPDPLFELVVKSVCDHCNNGWMNDLDSDVESFILEHSAEADVRAFRRWAIKVAILRSYYHHPLMPQPGDFEAIYNGDIAAWHIFVGRTAFPSHSHIFAGYGISDAEAGGRIMGVTQVTWSLGTVFVVAMRIVDDCESGKQFLRIFKQYNRDQGILVAEVLSGATRLPEVDLLPEISLVQFDHIAWFMSAMRMSPISAGIRKIEDFARETMDELGTTYTEI